MAFVREIIHKILQFVKFRISQNAEKDSYYTEIGNTLLRLSNHCTRLRVWDNILEKNPKWKGLPIISIVFEMNESTFDDSDCLILKRYRMRPIKVTEFVYNLEGQSQLISKQDINEIIKSIKNIQNGNYEDPTGKCNEPQLRISQNPSLDCNDNSVTNETDDASKTMDNVELNCAINMKGNKKLIRLSERQLRDIMSESVSETLNLNS